MTTQSSAEGTGHCLKRWCNIGEGLGKVGIRGGGDMRVVGNARLAGISIENLDALGTERIWKVG